jgi:hypothetical protein
MPFVTALGGLCNRPLQRAASFPGATSAACCLRHRCADGAARVGTALGSRSGQQVPAAHDTKETAMSAAEQAGLVHEAYAIVKRMTAARSLL